VFVVLKETVVVAGEPVTLPAGLLEVNVTELGVTLPLLTVASRGKSPSARAAAATIVSRLTCIFTFLLSSELRLRVLPCLGWLA
jgi:hypothetical protein